MANNEKRTGRRRVHRGKARQVSHSLCDQVREIHNNGHTDTRIGNPLFHASENDMNQYRSAKAREASP